MDINATGQVSSLAPDVTRPHAPAKAQPDDAPAAASAGGAPQSAPSTVVTDVSADAGVSDDGQRDESSDAVTGVDITV